MSGERTAVPVLPGEVLGADLSRAAAWLAKQVELALATVDLSPPQYRVLAFLDEGSAQSSALARRLAVRPPSVTAVMVGLVGRGLVERHHCTDDRRRVSHVLTAAGRRALHAADEAVGSRLGAISGTLEDPLERSAATEGLAVWRQAMISYRQRAHA